MKYKTYMAAFLITISTLTFAGYNAAQTVTTARGQIEASSEESSRHADTGSTGMQADHSAASETEFFSQRDLEADYDTEAAVNISLNGTAGEVP